MKKIGLLLLSATGAMVLAGCSLAAKGVEEIPERNQRIIVEVDANIKGLTLEGIKNSQTTVYNNIKAYATSNVRKVGSYDTLVNGFVLDVNSNDVSAIREVPGVKSVTVDKIHDKKVINNDSVELFSISKNGVDEIEENISATTMNKPEETYDGEGTIVAILDNEFHFRGATGDKAEWHHEVYDPLDSNVKVRYDFDSIKKVSGLKAKRVSSATAGQEGSLYFNNKVPFYYDYGGVSTSYGKPGTARHDVHSEVDYHGSHVSSITAANAPTYKGIAPKAQLACMKVFTEYDAKGGIGSDLGLPSHTGAYDSVILAALEDCIKLKVDGINMSLGSDLDDFDGDSITLKTLTRLHEEGILSAISAGNSGKTSFSFAGAYGNWGTEMTETGIMSSYANNAASMTIASGQPTKIFFENAFKIGEQNVAFEDQIVNREGLDDDYSEEFRISDLGTEADWVYIPGFGTTADYDGFDVDGKVAVVNRGSTSFADKYAIARTAGAIALVIINNDPTASDFNFRCSFGDGFNPTMPCALVLYKNKLVFEQGKSGHYELIKEDVSENQDARTMSTFSTDGATFDLDLKPEITAPGDNIKGAVPEHALTSKTKEEREALKNKAYQYLSGTSMSAPNYAGAQSVVLSKKTGPMYQNNETLTKDQQAEITAYRRTVDMRLMSTANPMLDSVENPETNVKSTSSPRLQGAGMVDLAGALNTDVYLEGMNAAGEGIGKSKIALRNNEDIANGKIILSFIGHNEGDASRNYNVSLKVMRPAIAHPNDIVTKDYQFMGEIDDIEDLPGSKFYDTSLERMATASGSHAYKDAYKISKDIEYFSSEENYQGYQYYIELGDRETAKEYQTVIKAGFYYNASQDENTIDWQPLPSYTAMSVKDVEIANVPLGSVSIVPGSNSINLQEYDLTTEAKDEILATFEYGCMIEGYVTFESTDGHEDLSLPYLGFYSGTDRNADASYSTAPVVEPFSFEKDITQVYPSDLVNDVTKSLIGKDKVNFESMMVAGYAERPELIDTDKVLANDQAFDNLTGFYKLGTNPLNNEYVENPAENLYLGSPSTTNTLIIQQFVLRSVADNYFTIVNKNTGETTYKSTLEDMLFGDTAGKWALYKSHVDAGYLSAGYVAHRAYAIVPLYDTFTGEAFASGEYELTFNYQLQATGVWVNKSYTLHIDSDAPQITGIKQYTKDGVERVRFDIDENRVAYGVVGMNRVEVLFDESKGIYYIDEEKSFINDCINEVSSMGGRRLYIRVIDFARGYTGSIIHFEDEGNYGKKYTIVQATGLTVEHDFKYEDGNYVIIDNYGNPVVFDTTSLNVVGPKAKGNNNNLGLILGLSIGGSVLLIAGGILIFFLIRKKKKGGK